MSSSRVPRLFGNMHFKLISDCPRLLKEITDPWITLGAQRNSDLRQNLPQSITTSTVRNALTCRYPSHFSAAIPIIVSLERPEFTENTIFVLPLFPGFRLLRVQSRRIASQAMIYPSSAVGALLLAWRRGGLG